MPEIFINNDSCLLDYRPTPWDIKALGRNCSEISKIVANDYESASQLIARYEKIAQEEKIEYSYCRVDANMGDLRRAFMDAGYYMAEASMELSASNIKRLAAAAFSRINLELEACSIDDLSSLKEIAAANFHYGRFFDDPYLPTELARKRHSNWVEDLLKPPFMLYTAKAKGVVVGFHAERLNVEDRKVDWVLTGVSEQNSIYALPLWVAALNLAEKHQIRKIETMISAANVKVMNLYSILGFRTDACLFGLHKQRVF